VVVIDALDEIEGNDQGPQLINQLIQAVSVSQTGLNGLKFFVSSRPHPGIVAECSSIDRKAVYRMEDIAPKEAIEDVRLFVQANLKNLPRAAQDEIVAKSLGLFIYAATIVRYLCRPSHPLSSKQQEKHFDLLKKSGLSSNSKHELLIGSLYDTILA
jgi:hypothetical protein